MFTLFCTPWAFCSAIIWFTQFCLEIFFIGIYALLMQNLFSCNLCCFVAKPVMLQFMQFLCGNKLSTKSCLWKKMTNIRYVHRDAKSMVFIEKLHGWKIENKISHTLKEEGFIRICHCILTKKILNISIQSMRIAYAHMRICAYALA